MKKINTITKYAFLMFAMILIASAAEISAQALPQKEYEGKFNEFKVEATVYANEKKDSDGKEIGWENCRVKITIKNTSSSDIMDWFIEYAVSKDAKSFESKTKRKESWLKPGATRDFTLPYCGVRIYDIYKK